MIRENETCATCYFGCLTLNSLEDLCIIKKFFHGVTIRSNVVHVVASLMRSSLAAAILGEIGKNDQFHMNVAEFSELLRNENCDKVSEFLVFVPTFHTTWKLPNTVSSVFLFRKKVKSSLDFLFFKYDGT